MGNGNPFAGTLFLLFVMALLIFLGAALEQCSHECPTCPEVVCSDEECAVYCAEYAREVPTLQVSPAEGVGPVEIEVKTLETPITLETPETPIPVDRRSQE